MDDLSKESIHMCITNKPTFPYGSDNIFLEGKKDCKLCRGWFTNSIFHKTVEACLKVRWPKNVPETAPIRVIFCRLGSIFRIGFGCIWVCFSNKTINHGFRKWLGCMALGNHLWGSAPVSVAGAWASFAPLSPQLWGVGRGVRPVLSWFCAESEWIFAKSNAKSTSSLAIRINLDQP